jgi:hypothetical protein
MKVKSILVLGFRGFSSWSFGFSLWSSGKEECQGRKGGRAELLISGEREREREREREKVVKARNQGSKLPIKDMPPFI